MRNKSFHRSFYVVYLITFFLFTISYAQLVDNYDQWNSLKYISIIIILILSISGKSGRKFAWKKTEVFLGGFFLSISVLSCLTQRQSMSEALLAISYIVVLLLYLFYGKSLFQNTRTLSYAAVGILLAVIVVLVLSPKEIIHQLTVGLGGRRRLYGKFSHPNIFASMMLSALLFLDVSRRLSKARGWTRWLNVLACLCAVVLVFLTDSRTTIIILCTYYAYIVFHKVRNKLLGESKVLFGLFISVFTVIFLFVFAFEFVFQQETFIVRIDAFTVLQSLSPTELIFGRLLASSKAGTGFEFALYTIIFRLGILGVIGFGMIFAHMWKSCKAISGEARMLSEACILAFAVSLLGEAYVVNITHVFSCAMYTLIGSLLNPRNDLDVNI